jgi:hypothetical protein
MKKAVKKVTKKEAAIPKGKAVAEKGKVAVIEFKEHDKNTEKTHRYSQLYLRGKKTPYRFENDFDKYSEHYQGDGIAYDLLKEVKSMDFPEEYSISLVTKIKLPLGQISELLLSRKGEELEIVYSFFLNEKDILGFPLNPIRLYKDCFGKLTKGKELGNCVECEIFLDDEDSSYFYIHYDHSRNAKGTLGDDIATFPAMFEVMLHVEISRLLAELTPSKKKK